MGRYRRFLTVGTYGTVGFRVKLRTYLRYLTYGTYGTVPAISPKFYLSFTILPVVSFILVKYPDRIGLLRYRRCEEYTPSTRDTYPFLNPYPHVNTVTMSELITTSSAYIINGDSLAPMTSGSVANTVAMTTFAVHTLQPLIFYRLWAHSPRRNWSATPSLTS